MVRHSVTTTFVPADPYQGVTVSSTTRAAFAKCRDIAADIPDGATIAVAGSGGGLVEPDSILEAIEAHFLATGHPRDLTLVHGFGLGDGDRKGTNRFAHEGMVRRVVGSHWTWSPAMVELARTGAIEAYSLPAGVMAQLMREIGARRPGLFTKIGLGTFVDPRQRGGRVNDRTLDVLVEVVQIDGEEYLHYKPFQVDLAIIRGSAVDGNGSLTLRDEAAFLDVLALAEAAQGSGGKCVAQVKYVSDVPFHPHTVRVPGPLIDTVVIAPEQWQTYVAEFQDSLAGTALVADMAVVMPADDARRVIARRAAMEVVNDTVINVGFGISTHVIDCLAQQGRLDRVVLAIEQGHYGGVAASGPMFGMSHGSSSLVATTDQFDIFGSGRLDVTCLGMGEMDAAGNVNVSRLAGRVIGPGGFIDISQNAKRSVFCGTFTARGLRVRAHGGRLQILQEGSVSKLVPSVEEITFAGQQAQKDGREALYVTERAVFALTSRGVELREVAPGIDIETDVLQRMGFVPIVENPVLMPAELFESLETSEGDL